MLVRQPTRPTAILAQPNSSASAQSRVTKFIAASNASTWCSNVAPVQILGGRELLEHERLGQLPREGSSGYLHVYAKLTDLSSLSLSTAAGQTFVYNRPKSPSPSKSALTASLPGPSPDPKNAGESKRYSLPADASELSDDILEVWR